MGSGKWLQSEEITSQLTGSYCLQDAYFTFFDLQKANTTQFFKRCFVTVRRKKITVSNCTLLKGCAVRVNISKQVLIYFSLAAASSFPKPSVYHYFPAMMFPMSLLRVELHSKKIYRNLNLSTSEFDFL